MADIVILATHNTIDHTSPLLQHFGDRAVVESNWSPAAVLAHHPDLIITFEESEPERGLCIAEMARQNVATLLVMDGIPEWRNTWKYRAASGRPMNQPILSHKVACLGRADARLYESWGNIGKCEVVGAPRLDKLVGVNHPNQVEPIRDRPMRLLVMTAKMPGFTPEQIATTKRSLHEIDEYLSRRDDVQVIWRVTQGLHKELGIKNTFTEAIGREFHEILAQVDAVITTPSTAMLEGMLFGLPVSLLDYHNCPAYIPAAWRISSREHIEPVLDELRNPPLERMLYQEFCLHDALSCRTPALPRLVRLIEEMIEIKRDHDSSQNQSLEFPFRILDEPEEQISWPSQNFDLQKLYPSHPVFGRTDITAMQTELDAALATNEQLKKQVNLLTQRLHGIPGYLAVKSAAKFLGKLFK